MTDLADRPAPDAARVLAVLAGGIIPADERDGGAAAVHAGPRLAERMRAGLHADLYTGGLRSAERLAQERFARWVTELGPPEVHELLERLRTSDPAFFKQLRTDVTALYLSDAGVCERIGFPGPSLPTGGYLDFDQPQGGRQSRTTPAAGSRGAS